MSIVVPTPGAAMPPYAECIRPDGSVGPYEPGPPGEIVAQVVLELNDALLAIFQTFPETEVIAP